MRNRIGLEDYSGAIHLHSLYSDGTLGVEEIMALANRAGCDYIILTDHNTLAPLHTGKEGWYGRTLLLVGEEISTDTDSHYLALGLGEEVTPWQSAQATVNAVAINHGLGFIAHPFGVQKKPLWGLTGYPWADWSISGFTGLEIWNFTSDWLQDILANLFLMKVAVAALQPHRLIQGPMEEALKKWDELTAGGRRVVGIGGIDAHGIVLSYRLLLHSLHTHLMTREPFNRELNHDKFLVLDALARGHCYVAYDRLAPAGGFCLAVTSGGNTAIMGDTVPYFPGAVLKAWSPVKVVFRLWYNGRLWHTSTGETLRLELPAPGVYRLEAYRTTYARLLPWVFANPVYLRA